MFTLLFLFRQLEIQARTDYLVKESHDATVLVGLAFQVKVNVLTSPLHYEHVRKRNKV